MYTPGPWGIMPEELNLDENGIAMSVPHRGRYIYNMNNTLLEHYGTGAICEFVHTLDDAKLIAAAPELLIALKNCVAYIERTGATPLCTDIAQKIIALVEE